MIRIKRILSAIIDFYIICFLSSLIVFILTVGKMNTNLFTVIIYLFSVLFLWLMKDYTFRGQSIGKKFLKLRIISNNQSSFNFNIALKRFLPMFFLPLEVILLIKRNIRIGDVWAETTVVSTLDK